MNIGIIGGGAAGFFAAVNIAIKNPNVQITILEKNENPMHKLSLTGGGRCNITNATFDNKELIKNYPRGGKELLGCFMKFGAAETINWFENYGIEFYTENETHVFPKTNKAETIIDLLLDLAIKYNVKIYNSFQVTDIISKESKFEVFSALGKSIKFDKLLITTGDNREMWKIINVLGHSVQPPVPSLFALEIKENWIKELSGTVIENVSFKFENEKKQVNGVTLITHKGLSGPGVLKFSSVYARELHERKYQSKIIVNWTGRYNIEDVANIFNQEKNQHPKRKVYSHPLFNFTHAFWNAIIKELQISNELNWSDISKKTMNQLAEFIVNCQLNTGSKFSGKDEFVTCGGVNLKEVDFKTMQSKKMPNLFFAGETLDIDGFTGGYNLQAAWTTAWIASENVVC